MKIINWGITIATAIVIPLMLTLQSCEDSFNSDTRENLRQLTELADTNAYEASNQARVYISSGKKLSDDNAMRLKLLNIKLADKFDKLKPKECIHIIDTIITHFKRINDREALSESFYYKGRIYAELGYLTEAIDQFELAKKYYTPNHRFYYGYTIGSQAAFLYNSLNAKNASLQEILYSYHIALKSNNVKLFAIAEVTTASKYLTLDSLDKAELHLQGLFKNYLSSDTSILKTKATIQLANLRTKQNRLVEADSLIHVIEGYPESDDTEALTFVKAMLYSKMGETEKAEFSYREMLKNGGYSDRRTASNRLLEIAIKKHDWELAKLVSDAAADVDSIQRIAVVSDQTQRIDNMQFLMDSADRAEARAKEFKSACLWEGAALFVLLGVAIFLALKLRENRIREDERRKITMQPAEDVREPAAASEEKKKIALPSTPSSILTISHLDFGKRKAIKPLSEDDWREIEKEVKEKAPDFYKTLLGMGISTDDFRMSILIKAGVRLTDIATLILRSKAAVSSTRKNLCGELLDVETPSGALWDEFILRLSC